MLTIRKDPTNRKMNANTSSGVPMNVLMVFSVLCSAAAAACWPVAASAYGGSVAAIRSRRSVPFTPDFAVASIESYLSCPARARSAVFSVKSASVAPARLSEVPNPAMPLIVNWCCAESVKAMEMCRPTLR